MYRLLWIFAAIAPAWGGLKTRATNLTEYAVDKSATALQQCLNCDAAIVQEHNYCPVCGQKVHAPRLTLREISEEFIHAVAHVDRSALSLILQLLVRPGTVALEYVSGKRKRYFGPFGFLVVAVAFTSAVIAISGFQAVITDSPNEVADFLQRHINLLFFAQVPLLALSCRLIGIRERFNYAEYLVLASYTAAMHILYYSVVVVPIWCALHSNTVVMVRLFYANLPIGPLYFAYGMYQFLPGRRLSSAVKGLLASLLAQAMTLGLITAVSTSYT